MRIETPSAQKRIGFIIRSKEDFGRSWQLLYSATMILTFSAFVALSKEYFRVPLHVPGHSAVYVIPLMLIGRLVSRSRFGGTGIGFLSGGVMAFMGLGGGFLLGIPRYFFMGVVMDALLWKQISSHNLVLLVAAGAFANFAKFLVGMVVATLVGIPAFFIQLGMTYSAVTHITFGALGGVLAVGIVVLAKRMQKKLEKNV